MFQTCSFLWPQMQPKSICLSAIPLLCQGIGVNVRLLSPALSSLSVTSWAKRNSKCVGIWQDRTYRQSEIGKKITWNIMKQSNTVKQHQWYSMMVVLTARHTWHSQQRSSTLPSHFCTAANACFAAPKEIWAKPSETTTFSTGPTSAGDMIRLCTWYANVCCNKLQ